MSLYNGANWSSLYYLNVISIMEYHGVLEGWAAQMKRQELRVYRNSFAAIRVLDLYVVLQTGKCLLDCILGSLNSWTDHIFQTFERATLFLFAMM